MRKKGIDALRRFAQIDDLVMDQLILTSLRVAAQVLQQYVVSVMAM